MLLPRPYISGHSCYPFFFSVFYTLYIKGESEPLTNSPCSDFTTLSFIPSNEVCAAHEITPRLIRDLHSQADVAQDRRQKSMFSGKLESSKQNLKNRAQRQPSRQSLAGIFGILNFFTKHRPAISNVRIKAFVPLSIQVTWYQCAE